MIQTRPLQNLKQGTKIERINMHQNLFWLAIAQDLMVRYFIGIWDIIKCASASEFQPSVAYLVSSTNDFYVSHSVICSGFVSLFNYEIFHLPFKINVDIVLLYFNSRLAYGQTILHVSRNNFRDMCEHSLAPHCYNFDVSEGNFFGFRFQSENLQ